MSENNGIKRAKEELDKISQDAKERRLAELREKALMDEIAIREFAEHIRELGYVDFFAYLLENEKAVKKIKETLS